jgi:hypothetical protein
MVRLAAKVILFAVSLAALLTAFETVLTSTTAWKRYEDPRERILWDGAFDGTRIVLLGGSEFASVYVNALSDAVWTRLEVYTGQRVFPGALNGARLLDVLAAVTHVSREWPAGTTVFIGVPPTRFVASHAPEPPAGNFATVYFRLYGVDGSDASTLRRFKGQIYRRGLKPFLAERTRTALAALVDPHRPPPWMRHRVWSDERAAQDRFEFFERNLIPGADPRPLGALNRMKHELDAAGMRPVFVLTPLNEPLIRAFARVRPAESTLHDIRRTIAAVRTNLDQNRAEVVDFTDGVPSPCFFDLVHVNTCGDDLMAKQLSEWINRHP